MIVAHPAAAPTGGPDRGWLIAGSAGVLALTIRAVYAFAARPVLYPGTDNTWYLEVARSVADGRLGRVEGLTGSQVWTFRFPPAYPWFLGAAERALFWVRALDAARWASVAAGALAAVLVARLAWRWTASARPGSRILVTAVAGGVLAVGPVAAGSSAALMSESLFLPVVAGVLLTVDHLLDEEAGAGWTAVLAGLLVVGALTRVEGLLALGAPVVAVAVLDRRSRRHVMRAFVAVVVGLLAVGAWSTFASIESGRPVAIASNGGPLLGANCGDAQYGEAAGSWLSYCLEVPREELSASARRVLATPERLEFGRVRPAGAETEAEVSRVQLDESLDRIADDPFGFAHAIPFRLARAAGVYWTSSQLDLEVFEGRDRGWEAVGRWFHLVVIVPLVIVAAAGFFARDSEVGRRLRRLVDARRLVPGAALFGIWAVGIVVTYGSTRLRAPVEPLLAALAGLGAGVLALRSGRTRTGDPWSG